MILPCWVSRNRAIFVTSVTQAAICCCVTRVLGSIILPVLTRLWKEFRKGTGAVQCAAVHWCMASLIVCLPETRKQATFVGYVWAKTEPTADTILLAAVFLCW